MNSNPKGPNPVSRRRFLKTTVANGTAGIAAVAAAGLHPKEAEAADIKWDRTADVVVIGAGVSGLACACAASDTGASVIMIEENFDIGGRGIMSGGSIQLGGGHSLQKKYGTVDSADMIFADWTRHDHPASRYSDRDIVRKFADENAATFEFLLARRPVHRSRRKWKRSDDQCRPYLPDGGMAHPQPARCPASRPERIRTCSQARGKRAQSGRADPAEAFDDEDRPRESFGWACARNHRT